MMRDFIFAVWFLLPGAAANVTPILTAAMPGLKRWDAPIDGRRRWRGKPLLGAHKTWRGLLTGVVAGGLAFAAQVGLVHLFGWQDSAIGRTTLSLPLLLGPCMGFGALAGDAVESFFKRQRGVKAGGSWIPFDQIDYIIGALLAAAPFIVLSPGQYISTLLVWFLMHLGFSYLGWRLGLKDAPI